MKKTLRQIYEDHDGKISDKWNLYLDEWERLFISYREKQTNILEIGIQNGGSLEIWAKYFLHAEKIVGCDINPKCENLRYLDDRIAVVVGDANTDDCENEILRQAPTFDIIIDDGSHMSGDIVRSFASYFPHLNNNGIYAIEDLHCSYWVNFEGGLHNPFSAISFFKRLVDILNYEHWRNNKSRGSLLTRFTEEFGIEFSEIDLSKIHSVEFVNSLCIVRKSPEINNLIGKRVVVGKDELVSSILEELNGTSIFDNVVEIKDDEKLDIFVLDSQIQRLKEQLAERDAEVLQYELSMSWRITRPLRKFKEFIKTGKNIQ